MVVAWVMVCMRVREKESCDSSSNPLGKTVLYNLQGTLDGFRL